MAAIPAKQESEPDRAQQAPISRPRAPFLVMNQNDRPRSSTFFRFEALRRMPAAKKLRSISAGALQQGN
jgi:hypothetical protein